MKKTILLILLLSIGFSQTPGLSKGFGFAAGMQSGIGFSYRDVGEKHGFQITVGAIGRNYDDDYFFPEASTTNYDVWVPDVDEVYTEYSYDDGFFWGNLGALYIRPFHRAEKSLFYGFLGLSAQYNLEKYSQRNYHYVLESGTNYTYEPIGSIEEVKDTELTVFGGIGLGLSYNLTKNITFSLELPLTVSSDGDIWMVVPQGAIHYYYR